MKDEKKEYIYLIQRKSDGVKFVTYGNFKFAYNRPCALFAYAPDSYEYKNETPYGNVYNVSCDEKYDSKRFSVVHQTEMGFFW